MTVFGNARKFLYVSLIGIATAVAAVPADDHAWISLFDGQTLTGWNGDPQFWSVRDGALTGTTSAASPSRGNTFLIYTRDTPDKSPLEYGDFELKLTYRVTGHNSGIQYRSFIAPGTHDGWRVGGYQADMDAENRMDGANYGEQFRRLLAARGERATLTGTMARTLANGRVIEGAVRTVEKLAGSDQLEGVARPAPAWNEMHIIARGFRFIHKVNGRIMSEVIDADGSKRRASGLIAIQLHGGPPMTVQVKDIYLKATPAPEADYTESGNLPPRAHRLAVDEESALLADVTVPEGFEASLFASWQMANYPTNLAAAPNGDLYVSSDGNGSSGRAPGRGRVLRLRDVDSDGRADTVTEFIPEIDTPRGIVWDHDRLYVLHPPHVTVYFDQDGDGVAERSQRLISNIAFGFADRAGNHTTNGLEMGIDGWIYVAVGDYGFMKASGTDGRSLQLHGGGVVRFRPDGGGLELFSEGTRNIYGIAVSPTLDLFTRDNTNDGAGWNLRFHHFTGLDDHGYPRLYKNFADEAVAPLADYGGGSGCGAFYLDEPGIPAPWNKRPYTVDWGREGSYRHAVTPAGATFSESAPPRRFFKMTQPTDGDVDGMSAIYQSAWKGPAKFSWNGVNHGYIARMAPTDFKPAPLPDFAQLGDTQLVALIRDSSSHVRRLSAQRMLLRRPASETTTEALLALATDRDLGLPSRVAALYAIAQRGLDSRNSGAVFAQIRDAVTASDPLMSFVTRASGDLGFDLRTAGKAGPVPAEWLAERLRSQQSRQILEAIVAATRQGKSELAPSIAPHLASTDPVIAHTAYRALAQLNAWQETLPMLESDHAGTRQAGSWALMRMHDPALVDALLQRLVTQSDAAMRRPIIAVLCRLYHQEAAWQGDSWATRPDSRGPYYQLATWEESARILQALNAVLEETELPSSEASFLVTEMGRNRIPNDAALDRILALARRDPGLLPAAIAELRQERKLLAQALALVLQAARSSASPPTTLQQSVELLLESEHTEAFSAMMSALGTLQEDPAARRPRDEARKLLLGSPRLEHHVESFSALLAGDVKTPAFFWAAQALLQLAHSKAVSSEARERARRAIEEAWADNEKKLRMIDATVWSRVPYLNDHIAAAMNDPDPRVARIATRMAAKLRIPQAGTDKTPKVGALKPKDAIAQAVAYKTGSAELGEAVFVRATCTACHTVQETEAQKGPYLGSIASIYRRQDLAEAIVLPNASIAQGFATQIFTLKDGQAHAGFVTNEAGEVVTIRDITSAERSLQKSQITDRSSLPTSLMPPALLNTFSIHEFASLLDYLESLANKQ